MVKLAPIGPFPPKKNVPTIKINPPWQNPPNNHTSSCCVSSRIPRKTKYFQADVSVKTRNPSECLNLTRPSPFSLGLSWPELEPPVNYIIHVSPDRRQQQQHTQAHTHTQDSSGMNGTFIQQLLMVQNAAGRLSSSFSLCHCVCVHACRRRSAR